MGLSSFSGLRILTVSAAIAVGAGGIAVAPQAHADDGSTKAATSISIRLEHQRIAPGHSDDVRGNIRIPGIDPAGREVSLEAKPRGADAFTPVALVTARDQGGLLATVAPEVSTRYRWSYAGADDARARRSGVVTLVVRERGDHPATRLSTSLSIRAVQAVSGAHGDIVQGRLRSDNTPLPNRRVNLVAKTAGQSQWHFVAAKRTADQGRVRFHVDPKRTTGYRLVFGGTQVFRPSQSGVAYVRVRPVPYPTSLSIRGRDAAETFVVSGVLRGHGHRLAHRTVTLEESATSGADFEMVGTDETGRRGGVKFEQPPTPGASYRLSYAGGKRFAASTSGVVVD